MSRVAAYWQGVSNLSAWRSALGNIVITGDSLTQGGFIINSANRLANQLPAMATRIGLSGVTCTGYGYGGENSSTLKGRMGEVLNANPKLVIMRWGMNDCGRSDVDFEADLREAITRLRNTGASPAGKTFQDLSILLLGPNSANYPVNGVTPTRISEISQIMKTVAVDTQCAFFDVYGAYPDVHTVSYMLDIPYFVHPVDYFETAIADAVASGIFVDRLAGSGGKPAPPHPSPSGGVAP